MKQILLGYRQYDFAEQGTGRQVAGCSLYTMFESNGVEGHEIGKISLKEVPANIKDYLGVEFDVDFNGKGKVIQVRWPAAVKSGSGAPGSGGGR